MGNFSKIGNYVSGYGKYLNHAEASECVKHMRKEKKSGKVLVKFFKKAIECKELHNDEKFRKLFDYAVQKSNKLSEKEKKKFKKVQSVFAEKLKKGKVQAKPPQASQGEVQAKPPKVSQEEQLLGPKSREVAFAMDWSKDDPVLFNPAYIKSLTDTHPDIVNPFISMHDQSKFLGFLKNIMGQDSYQGMTKENTDQLRQMTLAIMNRVTERKHEPQFKELYAAIVNQICTAIGSCSNRVNIEIENIFTTVNHPKDGSLGQRVRFALQAFRRQLFQKAIHTVVSQSPSYLSHEAASFNYYYGIMTKEFGLPPSIAIHDKNYESCAMKGQEENIKKIFEKEYVYSTILKKISDSIQDVYDISIPTQQFTDWVSARYSPEERGKLLDSTGNYVPECFVRLLKELEIFKA